AAIARTLLVTVVELGWWGHSVHAAPGTSVIARAPPSRRFGFAVRLGFRAHGLHPRCSRAAAPRFATGCPLGGSLLGVATSMAAPGVFGACGLGLVHVAGHGGRRWVVGDTRSTR